MNFEHTRNKRTNEGQRGKYTGTHVNEKEAIRNHGL